MPTRPWMMRTYSGHSTARASNELYRTNLAKGQTGLSVAFDLPTQLGYDPDAPEARGEVGKVGVPVVHLGHMRELMNGIPLADMNTSMTINATAPWLLALYIAAAQEQGAHPEQLAGTTQNDLLKEFLSRGAYVFPPEHSLRLTVDLIAYTVTQVPKWNPINVCSYHLQEAGATPVQEVAFSLANAIAVLDAVRASGQVPEEQFGDVVGRISFFCNAGIRFIEEVCKQRAFTQMWDRIAADRFGVTDASQRRFRYGVQVNSLGLTEAQPENNVQRIVLEMLGVTLSASARARAIQLPAWNEALGLPRPWDQQWSLRMQQVLAYETDLLEYGDIFAGSHVVETKTAELIEAADEELREILDMGGAYRAIDEMKGRLVGSLTERTKRIESGDQPVVGVNVFTESAPSPLGGEGAILRVDPAVGAQLSADVAAWRDARDQSAVDRALAALADAAASGANVMPASIALALAGGTTGEWGAVMRAAFGEFRAPTGVAAGVGRRVEFAPVARTLARELAGGPPRILVAKPGLDGHSNGAEQIAVAARDVGCEVIYAGIRSTPEQVVRAARDEDVDLVAVSILSGSHMELVPQLLAGLRELGVSCPVVVGGIIPEEDRQALVDLGVAAVYTPKDIDLARIMAELVELVANHRRAA